MPAGRPTNYKASPMRMLAAALIGGVIAGTLDVYCASVIYHIPFLTVFQIISTGILGKASYQGGLTTSLMGFGLQWFISTVAGLIYIGAGLRATLLLRKPWLVGPLFGAAVFFVMRWVIVPLSNANPGFPPPLPLAFDFLSNMVFGTILAFAASTMLRARS